MTFSSNNTDVTTDVLSWTNQEERTRSTPDSSEFNINSIYRKHKSYCTLEIHDLDFKCKSKWSLCVNNEEMCFE